MKTHQIIPILAVLLILPLLSLQSNAAATQSNVAIFNITITASGGDNLTIGSSEYNLIIGEPVTGLVNTNVSNLTFGFFYSQKTLNDVTLVINQAPYLPVWINPTNNTAILTDNLVILQYSSSDPENDTITYYLYQNGNFLRTSQYNVSTELANGSYNYSVAAYDGSKYSNNATVNFVVDVPVTLNLQWMMPVALIYGGVIIFYVGVGLLLNNQRFENSLSTSQLFGKDIFSHMLKGIKWLYWSVTMPLILLGVHLASLFAQQGGANAATLSSLNIMFQVVMWISILSVVIGLLFLLKMPLENLFNNVKTIADFRSFGIRGNKGGKRGKF